MKKYNDRTILIADDEPLNLSWLEDYISSIGYKVKFCLTAVDAIKLLSLEDYRAAIVDLNIPLGGKLDRTPTSQIYDDFPGLSIAQYARTMGTNGIRVVIYSVYQTETLSETVTKLGCDYVPKGRPKLIKDTIQSILSYDPKVNNLKVKS